jgi:hypothetical protein
MEEYKAREALEKLIKPALDASPHKIAIIRTTVAGYDFITVAWQDENGKILFADQNGFATNPVTTLEALSGAETCQASPLDFSIKHGAAASAKAESFMAEFKENVKAGQSAGDAARGAFDKVDPNFGVTPQGIYTALLKMGLGSLISGEAPDTDLHQAPPGGGVKADGYRPSQPVSQPGDAGVKADNYPKQPEKTLLDEFNKWVNTFSDAAGYLKILLGKLGSKTDFRMDNNDRILTKSFILNELKGILKEMDGKYGAAMKALGEIIKPYAVELNPMAVLVPEEGIVEALTEQIIAKIWPGVLDAVRENSRQVYSPVLGTWLMLEDLPPMVEPDSGPPESDLDQKPAAASDGDEGASLAVAGALLAVAGATAAGVNDAASQQAVTDSQEGFSQEQVALAPDTTTDSDEGASHSEQVVAPDTTTDGDQGASQEQVALAPDTTTDSDEGASDSEQVAVASDTDEEASHSDQAAVASDIESVSINYAAVMETAKAEVGVNPTLDDQAGPPGQPATSAVFSQEDSLSFSAFAKQGTPAEVANQGMPAEFAKQGMPADQLPAEAISTPGAPAGESAHHEVGSEDVGNAAPSKEPVVHHGDLTP